MFVTFEEYFPKWTEMTNKKLKEKDNTNELQ